MFPSTILRAAILVIAASAASATIYQICPICPQTDLAGYKLILGGTGYALDPPRRFCGYGDQGANGPITRCFYDNSGVFDSGTEYCPPGPIEVAVPPNCTTVSGDSV
ncbi:hypothetical protein CPB85DRAFT_1312357 [Mucidula mucida]|nr:hypothetical protein CPB85DRAFT_1345229 [Mucidula mucida]KAF8907113.1 hypothetical protein CPB85DRAFT_1312357 [Mucidula mucida]